LIKFITRIFGSRNQRLVKEYSRNVAAINALEDKYKAFSDAQLHDITHELKERVANGELLNSVLPEAFAAVREAADRTLGMRHYDVQFVGGMVLNEGKIAEMRTGEGKTLMATLPAYLNALSGDGVHVVTVNEYLACRDAEWMTPVYEFLGMGVGVIHSSMSHAEKKAAYAADIVYGTNNEFGFDYLRDNLAFRTEDQVQIKRNFAIVDEVDSILIDEARTPLIISGPSEESTDLYARINKLLPGLVQQQEEEGPGDYSVDEKSKQAYLTEEGHQNVEAILAKAGLLGDGESLYDAGNIRLMHHLTAALRAHTLFHKDVDYIVADGEIVIVDEFTGRTMPGRRWSDGLHQAVEAKEGLSIKEENQTVASITFQNYFRMYKKLSGMTGTADTEAYEFQTIYGLECVVIPTHRPMIRDDRPDLVYLNEQDKFAAIVEDIKDCRERGQPALVGTTSIETSELLSKFLDKQKIPHSVLNAKQHEREAQVVAEAGRPGAVTIATNMAGRGTDIVLGGNFDMELTELGTEVTDSAKVALRTDWQQRHQQVVDAGGLHIIGTERHESRRIDNQLRGRSGRQGDPGSSRFYLSMEDRLMQIFGDPVRTKSLLSRVGMREGEAIESGLLSRQIERAQRKVEAHNFDVRKSLLEFDDVSNDQRTVIYQQRNELMEAEDIGDAIAGIREEVIGGVIDEHLPPETQVSSWDVPGLTQVLELEFGDAIDVQGLINADAATTRDALAQQVIDLVQAAADAKAEQVGTAVMRQIEKEIMLRQLDSHWREHLAALDYLRQGIHLRGYAQKNPKQEYKREAFEMFSMMLDQVKYQVISFLAKLRIRGEEDVAVMQAQEPAKDRLRAQHADASQSSGLPGLPRAPAAQQLQTNRPAPAPAPDEPFVRSQPKVGRNEPCPCGSGKKYKQCHGKLT
jgi:preprotein translocase subunit SecA